MNRRTVLTLIPLAACLLFTASTTMTADVSPKAGSDLPRAFYLRRQQDPAAFTAKRAYVRQAERIRAARTSLMNRVAGFSADAAMREVAANETLIAVHGDRSIPVVPVRFKNTQGKPFEESALEARLFGSQGNTMRAFYLENSYGLLKVGGRVHPWQPLPENDVVYEGPDFPDGGEMFPCNGMCPKAKLPDMLKSALAAIDGSVDFRQFDNDGPDGQPNSGDDDGFADFVAFVQPETGGECGGPLNGPSNRNIWSHRWALTSWGAEEFKTNDDGIKVDDYVIMPALNCDGQTMIHIGVFAHEFGHAFGLPDLYDTVRSNGVSQGIGNWCLMASGSWGGDDQSPELPSHMSAWAKVFLGWLQPQAITATKSVSLPAVYTGRTAALKVAISNNLYYLIEYRNRTGFDAKLTGTGLLVWRINDSVVEAGLKTNRVNGDAANKGVDLVEADGRNHLDLPPSAGGNRGDGSDPYPGSTNNTKLDSTSNPKVQGNVSFCGIAAAGNAMTVLVQVGKKTCTP